MSRFSAYVRLFRLPGLFFLTSFVPGLFAMRFGRLPWGLCLSILLVTFLVRTMAIVLDDLADLHIDRRVERTKGRPLAAGEISVGEAKGAVLVLALLSVLLIVAVSWRLVALLAIYLIPILIYPYIKRFSSLTNVFLAAIYNIGAIQCVVFGVDLGLCLFAYAGCFFWTLGSETIYTSQDKIPDRQLGLRSPALMYGGRSRMAVVAFYSLFSIFIVIIGAYMDKGALYFGIAALAILHLFWQALTVDFDQPADCKAKFFSNRTVSLILFAAILLN